MAARLHARVTNTVEHDGHIEYIIQCHTDGVDPSYTINRRYSDFELLYKHIKEKLPLKDLPKFPRKHLLNNNSERTITERSHAFDAILEAMLGATFFSDEIMSFGGPFLNRRISSEAYQKNPQSPLGTYQASPRSTKILSPLSKVRAEAEAMASGVKERSRKSVPQGPNPNPNPNPN